MVEEIMHALQQHEPLCCKLHNHKADGRKFQNLLCLHPIFGKEGEYLYQESSRNSCRPRTFAQDCFKEVRLEYRYQPHNQKP